MLLRDIENLLNLAQFDPINRMISLTKIPLSGVYCIVHFMSFCFLVT
jgi:hypothetical protein